VTVPSVATLRARIEEMNAALAEEGGRGVRLVVVTKGHPPELARRVVAAGALDLGENVAQELLAKASEVSGATWHAIGRLQRNKVRRLAPVVGLWQTIDRLELGDEVARWAPGAAVLVQVNTTGEAQKGGCAPGDAEALCVALRDRGLDVRGLMTIGVAGDAARTSAAFSLLARLADDLELPERSMGMSDDWQLAASAGSTIVRVGRRIVGERTGPRAAAPDVGD
jgi:pyridoxal phosphate enzyme (YggS family)